MTKTTVRMRMEKLTLTSKTMTKTLVKAKKVTRREKNAIKVMKMTRLIISWMNRMFSNQIFSSRTCKTNLEAMPEISQ